MSEPVNLKRKSRNGNRNILFEKLLEKKYPNIIMTENQFRCHVQLMSILETGCNLRPEFLGGY